ncbi:MAG: hypothetical protein J7J31_00790 [Helicobacteraceae bacterium]|nr:hypothetical protein [Helicobacteraceae bacterium]
MKNIILSLILLNLTLFAHNIWIDDTKNVIYGHITKSHDGPNSKNKLLDKDELQSVVCQKEDAQSLECDLLFVTLKPKYYTKTPYGVKNTPKNETVTAMRSHLSHESVKRVYNQKGLAAYKHGFEITLTNKLNSIQVGDKLRVVVLEEGKPKEGVVVSYDDRSIGISDEEGHVNIKVRHTGLQNLQASYAQKGDGVTCDEIIYSTTLNFEVKK